jgi:hypothetical protein
MPLMTLITQEQFDHLAIFVAVANELEQEPFFSEDIHEVLRENGDGTFSAVFAHPAFLKSAILPFRRLFLNSEPCAFEGIRDFVFKMHPDQAKLKSVRYWFCDSYDRSLDEVVDGAPGLTIRDVLEIWIYTHAVHAGPKKLANTKHRTLQEFDGWNRKLTREKFEFLFRTHLCVVGSLMVSFHSELARPLMEMYVRENGMKPGFDAQAAITYNPYPSTDMNIVTDDAFWHLNKETAEETLTRLLARQRFASLRNLLVAFFRERNRAYAVVLKSSSFEELLANAGGRRLAPEEITDDGKLMYFGPGCGMGRNSIGFSAYEGGLLKADAENYQRFVDAYLSFLSTYKEERSRQSTGRCWEPHSRWDW